MKIQFTYLILLFFSFNSFSQNYNINGEWKSTSGSIYTVKQTSSGIEYSNSQGNYFKGKKTSSDIYVVRFQDGYNTIIYALSDNKIKAVDQYNKASYYWTRNNSSSNSVNDDGKDVGLNGLWKYSDTHYLKIIGQNAYDEKGNVILKNIKYVSDNKWSCYFGHSEDNWWCDKISYIIRRKNLNGDIYIRTCNPCSDSDIACWNYYKQ